MTLFLYVTGAYVTWLYLKATDSLFVHEVPWTRVVMIAFWPFLVLLFMLNAFVNAFLDWREGR